MKKGIYSEGSNSTLNKQNSTIGNSNNHCQGHFPSKVSSPTLEDLILQLEFKTKLSDDFSGTRRMSCVNNFNILRSTRKGLNQYPRFSLDGREAMYSRTFGNLLEGRRSVCCDSRRLKGSLLEENGIGSRFDKVMSFPHTLGGESVVWCKPGVVARLMGLEAMPLLVRNIRSNNKDEFLAVLRRQNLRRRFERQELET